MDIVNDIRELSPKKNERIMADLLGNGRFLEFVIIFIGRTCVRFRRIDGTQELTVKLWHLRDRERHEFWRHPSGLLNFRFVEAGQ